MLSVASWVGRPQYPGYAGSKAAEWSLTNSLREGLREQGTLVIGVHAGFVDTDFSKQFDAPKITPQQVAEQTMQAIIEQQPEVLADDVARRIKASLAQ